MTEGSVDSLRHDESTSSSLLVRAKARDELAWSQLVHLYSPLLKRWFVERWKVADQDIENLAQEVFLAVSRSLPSFRRDREGDSFRGWLYTIARRKFLDLQEQYRKLGKPLGGSDAQQMFEQVPFDDDGGDALQEEFVLLHERAVGIIRGEFSDRDWQIFQRAAVEKKTAKEVASELELASTNIIYLVVARIRRRLREEFGDIIEFPD